MKYEENNWGSSRQPWKLIFSKQPPFKQTTILNALVFGLSQDLETLILKPAIQKIGKGGGSFFFNTNTFLSQY